MVFNTRFLGQELTGVQRYGRELLDRFTGPYEAVRPEGSPSAIGGHWWEQAVLPRKCRGRLLWSPGNTGPLSITRQVVTIHDASTLDHPEWFAKKFALWYRFLLPRLARRVRKVITVSEFSRQRIIETCNVPANDVVVVLNGIDARFRPTPLEEIASFRARHQIERPYFLYLGSLEPRKNVATLLQAWKKLAPKDCDLVLGGSVGKVFRDSGFSELPAGCRLWGRVADDDLTPLLSGAVGFIFPSLYEGFGFPALEAMACGCPALISSGTCLPEICGPAFASESATGAALYFDPLDVDELIAGIRRLLAMDSTTRDFLCRNGQDRAAEFTWDRAATETWQVLEGARDAA
jgi:glycosyltransferase involved in cell wall biosynthesis